MALGPLGESALDNVSLEMKVAGGLAAMIASKDAFAGNEGVAAQPSAYCRRQSASGKTVWFESVAAEGAQRWVMPISETGITVEGTSIPVPDVAGNFKMQGVVLTNDYIETSVRGFYGQLPNPVTAQLQAMVSWAAHTKPYASVKHGTTDVILGD